MNSEPSNPFKSKMVKKEGLGSNSKLSKASQDIQNKWQQESLKRGGGTTLILKQQDAKQMIYNLMKDNFKPMNITMIYEELKAIIPSPVLKVSLDAMTVKSDILHDEITDDDLELKSRNPNHHSNVVHDDPHHIIILNEKKSNEPAHDVTRSKLKMKKKQKHASSATNITTNMIHSAGTIATTTTTTTKKISSLSFGNILVFKEGRNSNASIYYFRQGVLENRGNGMDHEERQEWHDKKNHANTQKNEIARSISAIESETHILRCQPLNEDLNEDVMKLEESVKSLQRQIQVAEHYKTNKAKMEKLKKCVESTSHVWRKRKTTCMDFLHFLEETSEGAISAKKCLNGSTGPIELETDEAAIHQAKLFYQIKKKRLNDHTVDKHPQYTVIGVKLGSNGILERVML